MRVVLKHLLLWVSIYVVYTYMMSFYDDLEGRAIANLVNVPLFMAAYYTLRYVQIPYLYNKDKKLLFALSLALSAYIIGAICRLNGMWWMDAYFGQDSESIPFMTMGAYLLKTVRYYTPAMAILAWEAHEQRGKELERMQLLEKEKLATELKFLKAQINPHFLFNTLNNLYSFVVNQSPKAPDMILHLSAILDYVLYKSQNKTVSLGEELDTIEHFLALEHIRYGDRLAVSFEKEGNMSVAISPLILLSLIENAFKHGASGDIGEPKIDIHIIASTSLIECKVWNTKRPYTGELNDDYKKGIGLSNIKRQLNLVYPNNHELHIDEQADAFSVLLKIEVT